MARKIKITIESKEKKLHLPAVPISAAFFFMKSGLWGSQFFSANSEDEFLVFLHQNKEKILALLQSVRETVKDCDPFTLVEIQSDQDFVLIELV